MRTRAPFLLKLIATLFFAATFFYFLQAVEAILNWNMLMILHYHLTPLYPVFQGVLLGGAFLISGVLLLKRLTWAPKFGIVNLIISVLWSWLDRTVLSLNPRPFSQQVFALAATVILLGLLVGGLWSLQPFMISSQVEYLDSGLEEPSSGEENEH